MQTFLEVENFSANIVRPIIILVIEIFISFAIIVLGLIIFFVAFAVVTPMMSLQQSVG